MTMKSLIGVMGALFAATLAWGQAVPSQIASVQLGGRGGSNVGNNIQLQYDLDHWSYNQSQEAFMQFNMSVFSPSLTASAIQKATLVLYVNNGGSPGTISICQVSQAWSAATITGINAPPCTNTATITFAVTNAELQQGGFIFVDITQIAQNWFATGNYGIALVPQAPPYVLSPMLRFRHSELRPYKLFHRPDRGRSFCRWQRLCTFQASQHIRRIFRFTWPDRISTIGARRFLRAPVTYRHRRMETSSAPKAACSEPTQAGPGNR